MKNILLVSTVLFTLMFMSCNDGQKSELGHNEAEGVSKTEVGGEDTHGEEGHDEGEEEGGHSEEEGVVELTKQQAETIGLETKPLEERNLGNNIKVTGTLELFPQDKANISPFVGGNVSSIKVIPGDNVSKGQVLAYIEHPDIIAMQQDYQEKNDELVFLKQDFERKQTLYDKGVSSGKEFQMAQSKFRSTTSSVNGLRSQLRLLSINPDKVAEGQIYSAVPITSPISGYVDEVMISLGDYVAQQSKMFSISDNSKIYVNFKVYEKDIKQIQKGQQIYFSTASRPDELLKATVLGRYKGYDAYKESLNYVALTYPRTEEGKKAQNLLRNALPTMKFENFDDEAISINYKVLYSFTSSDVQGARDFQRRLVESFEKIGYTQFSTSIDVYNEKESFVVIHFLDSRNQAEGLVELLAVNDEVRITRPNTIIASENYKIIHVHKNFDAYKAQKTN